MLVNFMHLVTAVRLADMRTMTEARIASFEEHYGKYIRGVIGEDHLGGLYPHTRVTPYQHMMLHFGDLLRRFGPVHSWRCFAFERFNYILQTTKTNSRFDELEHTMFSRFCMMQKLKSLFHGGTFPPMVTALATLYRETFENSDTRGSRINDALAFDDTFNSDSAVDWPISLPNLDATTVCKLLEYGPFSAQIRIHNRLKIRGLTFTPEDRSFPDAQVVYSIKSAEEWCAGSIRCIFTARKLVDGRHIGQKFAEIYPYKPLVASHAETDKYRTFGFAGGRLFYDILEDDTILIPVEQISSHFGYSLYWDSSIDVPTIHALPLNKDSEFDI
ncbi:hypothetical protein F5879DRAFT_986962 [Lentinula edodes]|nr:hypothetical protein F5879DRAFT_986962 [Lentinula edodes]